tara:strand:- start:1490 stop:2812 length:1323 start_codon:yes stop_codon:yes gene_type:complete
MKLIKSIALDKVNVKSSGDIVNYIISGDKDAVFSLQIRDSSSPTKFYNFETNVFETGITSEHTLSNVSIPINSYQRSVNIPASSAGNEYRFLVFAQPHFDTKTSSSSNEILLTKDLTQGSDVTVRFSTKSDQAAERFEGQGLFTNTALTAASTGLGNPTATGSSEASSSAVVNFGQNLSDAGGTTFLGYKATFNQATQLHVIADSKQPVESDFFATITKQLSADAEAVTSIVLDDVDNLIVGLHVGEITNGSVTTTGSLGIFTFPTITAIDTATNTVTLSAAVTGQTSRQVTFRAYGFDQINEFCDLLFSFDISVVTVNDAGEPGKVRAENRLSAATSNSKILTFNPIEGMTVGAKLTGAGLVQTQTSSVDGGVITAINTSNGQVTVTTNQTLADKTKIFVQGATMRVDVVGSFTITRFPKFSTDVFFDLDRACVLSTTS